MRGYAGAMGDGVALGRPSAYVLRLRVVVGGGGACRVF